MADEIVLEASDRRRAEQTGSDNGDSRSRGAGVLNTDGEETTEHGLGRRINLMLLWQGSDEEHDKGQPGFRVLVDTSIFFKNLRQQKLDRGMRQRLCQKN